MSDSTKQKFRERRTKKQQLIHMETSELSFIRSISLSLSLSYSLTIYALSVILVYAVFFCVLFMLSYTASEFMLSHSSLYLSIWVVRANSQFKCINAHIWIAFSLAYWEHLLDVQFIYYFYLLLLLFFVALFFLSFSFSSFYWHFRQYATHNAQLFEFHLNWLLHFVCRARTLSVCLSV